jgi:hypothetical protein
MIATKTTTLLVTMAVLGIVPVAAHAQPINITELVAQEGTATGASAPSQESTAANVDDDTTTQTSVPITYVVNTVGPDGTATTTITQPATNVVTDNDVQANDNDETLTAPQTTTLAQAITDVEQDPTFSVTDLPGFPGTP